MSVAGTVVGGIEVAVGGTGVALATTGAVVGVLVRDGVRVAVLVTVAVGLGLLVGVAVCVSVAVTVAVGVVVVVLLGNRVMVGASVGAIIAEGLGTIGTVVAVAGILVGFLVRTGLVVGTAVADSGVGRMMTGSGVSDAGGVLVVVCVLVGGTVVLGVSATGASGPASSDRTSRNPAIRTPNATGATIVRGNPAAVAFGRAGALLRPSSTLRLRGAVAAPVG